jgi:outer membrane receptor protein involved in Fe transport
LVVSTDFDNVLNLGTWHIFNKGVKMNAPFPQPRAPRPVTHCALGLLLTGATSVMAQTAAAPDASASAPAAKSATSPANTDSLETVTITATRRVQRLRDVPVAISKINTDQQLELGAKDLGDILESVPGVNYDNARNFGAIPTIRGVTTGADVNPATGVYVDDVPVGSSAGLPNQGFDQRLLDSQSIEVLKGPQGTLYGGSAVGGLLKYNNGAPDLRVRSGRVGAELSSTEHGRTNYTLQGLLNAPLSKGMAALRVAVFHSQDGGYIDAIGAAPGIGVNRGQVEGARVVLGLLPTQGLNIRLSHQQQDSNYRGSNYIKYNATGQPTAGPLVVDRGIPEPYRTKDSLTALNLDYDLGWSKFYSITGYQKSNATFGYDLNEAYPRLMPVTRVGGNYENKFDRTTQEFRLVSRSGGVVDWIVGAFYSKEKSSQSVDIPVLAAPPGSPFPAGTKLVAPNTGRFLTFKETALYSTVVWNVSSELALTAGARLTSNTLDSLSKDYGVITPNKDVLGSTSETPKTYLLAAGYKLTPTASLYARAASGFRAGGTNFSTQDPVTGRLIETPNYKSDSLWSYETGYKADLPNGKGNFEVALFQIDWKNIQQSVFDRGLTYQGNAGDAKIRGVEISGVLRVTDAWTLRGASSIQDAKLKEASQGLGASAGDRLPGSAKVQVNLNSRYDFEAVGAPAFVAANVNYVGDRNASFEKAIGVPYWKLPAYTTVSINGGLTWAGVDLGAYVRNLTDKRGQAGAYTIFVPIGGPTQVSVIRPRTIGLTASKSF